jgi:2-amino-4-hydroxy-6-hydroxymethyldihydropteridine diphosphokinase
MIRTFLSAEEFLSITQKIESELGRQKVNKNEYEDRVIDIDIIFYGDQIIKSDSLKIPHRKYKKRDFVLTPLAQLSNQIDPETFLSIYQFLE